MSPRDREVDRLLRAAQQKGAGLPAEVPFGFDTRIVALWRSQPANRPSDARELGRLVRWTGAMALVVIGLASAGAFWQIARQDEMTSPITNAYAIADSAIDTATQQ